MEARVRKNMVLGILGDFILRYALIKVTNDSPISSEIFSLERVGNHRFWD